MKPRLAKALTPARLKAALAIGVILISWLIGENRSQIHTQEQLFLALPSAERFESRGGQVYAAYGGASGGELIGHVMITDSLGYGGPLRMAVAVDLKGVIRGASVVKQGETPSYFDRVVRRGVLDALIGKSFENEFEPDADVDGVSGATRTVRAVLENARNASRQVAAGQLSLQVPHGKKAGVKLGFLEAAVAALFIAGYWGRRQRVIRPNRVRWLTLIGGLLVLGFLYNAPLTLSSVNRVLLGYLPDWRTDLHWYLLVGGILLFALAENKNVYCDWFCPFGATQECMGLIGGAQRRTLQGSRSFFRAVRGGLVLAAIAVALIFRSPGMSSYEIFGAMFRLIGSSAQFALLILVLVLSIFIRRPWCDYLCPIRPVMNSVLAVRRRISRLWKRSKPAPPG